MRAIFRNRRRVIVSVAGVVIALMLIFNVYFTTDSISKNMLIDELEKSDEHMRAHTSTDINGTRALAENLPGAVEEIAKLDYVKSVRYTIVMSFHVQNMTSGTWSSGPAYVVAFTGTRGVFTVTEGEGPDAPGEVAVAGDIPVEMGDSITFDLGMASETFTVVGTFSVSEENDTAGYMLLLALPGYTRLIDSLGDGYVNTDAEVTVTLDARAVVSHGGFSDMKKIAADTGFQVQLILDQTTDLDWQVANIMITRIVAYEAASPFILLFPLIFSTPVIVLGVYLSMVGIDIEIFERRRELGVMEVRGATRRDVLRMLLAEMLLYGVVGGIAGLLLGVLSGYYSTVVLMGQRYFFYSLDPYMFIASIVISVIFLLIAFRKPWSAVSSLPLVNLLSRYEEGMERAVYRSTKDIIISALLWAYLIGGWYVVSEGLRGGAGVLLLLVFVVFITLIPMLPVILFLLPLTTSRALVMGTTKIYGAIARALARLGGSIGDIVAYGVKRAPRRTASLTYILAFVLTLGLLLSSFTDSMERMSELNDIAECGGDVKAYVGSLDNATYASFISWMQVNATSMCIVDAGYATAGYTPVMLYAVDAGDYVKTVYDLDAFRYEGEFLTGAPNEVVLTRAVAREMGVSVGSYIYVVRGDDMHRMKVVGIYSTFPGIRNSGAAVVPSGVFSGLGREYVLARVQGNPADMAEYASAAYGVHMEYRGMGDEEGDTFASVFKAFLRTLIMHLVIIGTVAILVIHYSLLIRRRGEFALFMVRGGSRRDVAKIIVMEAAVVVILSLMVGLVTGLGISYVLLNIFATLGDSPAPFCLGEMSLWTLSVALPGFMLASAALGMLFSRTDVASVLRAMGGDM